MAQKTYSVFGAGAAGLYTAWRLLGGGNAPDQKPSPKALGKGDTLELFDWGKYDFNKKNPGTREAGARVCTWHYRDDPEASYLEVGGMRYSDWDGGRNSPGHRLVTQVIKALNLDSESVVFNESENPLFYLRTKNMYLKDISSSNPAPYNVDHYGATSSPDTGFSLLQDISMSPKRAKKMTRTDWCRFYNKGRIKSELGAASIYKKGDLLKEIGYWNLMFDQLGSEGYQYTADGNGYSSNVINWNAAVAIQANNEFTPGTEYRTLKRGYSSMFTALFDAISRLAREKGVKFDYRPSTRLHSILKIKKAIHYTTATRESPDKIAAQRTTDAAWLAMPRYALDLVSQATRYQPHAGLDVLNHHKVQLYLESVIMQPSYKVGMFFDQEWWVRDAKAQPVYPAELAAGQGEPNTIGPSVTDLPVRQVVYFGNNALRARGKPVYGLLASYDDEQFTTFWQELELGPKSNRKVALSQDYQPLEGPRKVPEGMVKMLRRQLAAIHFGPSSDFSAVPPPLEARYMDWSLPPFNAGYHAWAAHYDIVDVQRKIRKPSQLIDGADANIFIVGEAYSNDQAWVEGAYCTSESVLNDFFGIEPIISNRDYPFICEC